MAVLTSVDGIGVSASVVMAVVWLFPGRRAVLGLVPGLSASRRQRLPGCSDVIGPGATAVVV